ncbi:MAG: hypothetical protein ACRCUP_07045 [Mycoplasmatales bacterium]
MRKPVYMKDNIIIVDFSQSYLQKVSEVLKSSFFKELLINYISKIKTNNSKLSAWQELAGDNVKVVEKFNLLFRQLLVLELSEIESTILDDQKKLLIFIEGLFNYWKSFNRYSILRTGDNHAVQNHSFIDANTHFNHLVRETYRTIEEKVQGRRNNVYRQLQAGTNASISIRKNSPKLSAKYAKLNNFYFIDSLMLRTPLLLYPKSNTRKGSFTKTNVNPIEYFTGNKDEWFVMPIKVGSLLTFVYFNQDYIGNAVSLSNLFEFANFAECKQKPDLIVLFGNEDQKDETVYYYDEEEDLFIGSISDNEYVDYFGYMKKMSLTLHNLAEMKKGNLPIHGAFINVTLKNGKKKGIMLMGDSGAGKSETIEAMQTMGTNEIMDIEIIFDDMGCITYENGKPVATGTEIGAFIRLDDLDKGRPYQDMDRSIFMNPDTHNARVILPVCDYETITSNHQIDLFVYANNYDDKLGLRIIDDVAEAQAIFVEGKRMALNTTDEVGYTKTYFANPFGPMQEQELCQPLIDQAFANLKTEGIPFGEVYTHLGLGKADQTGLETVAMQLLEFLKK